MLSRLSRSLVATIIIIYRECLHAAVLLGVMEAHNRGREQGHRAERGDGGVNDRPIGIRGARRATSVASVVLVAILVAGVVVVARDAEGRASTRATFNDGGAWVGNSELHSVAHINRLALQFSGQVQVVEGQFDVVQAPGIVAVHSRTLDQLVLIDESLFNRHEPIALPEGSEVLGTVGGLVIVDSIAQKVYRLSRQRLTEPVDFESLEESLDESLEMLLYVASGPVTAAVGLDGALVVHDAGTGTLVRFTTEADRAESDPIAVSGPVAALTLVGATAVAHLPEGRALAVWDGSGRDVLVHTDPRLERPLQFQQPGVAASSVVAVDASGEVLAVNLRTGVIAGLHRLEGGAPIEPIVDRGCVFAVTVEPGVVLHSLCEGRLEASDLETTGRNLKLRLVNGWIWVNDTTNGAVWVTSPADDISRIDDWSQMKREGEGESEETEGAEIEQIEDNDADQVDEADGERDDDDVNLPPIAEPDQAAARKGRPVVVPVLANDSDPDGDVILVESVEPVPASSGVVVVTQDGLRVQFTPQAGFVGTVDFLYTISDGRGGTATATVTVAVNPDDDVLNRPPEAATDVARTSGTSAVSLNVLDNDSDPDGDSIFLADAAVEEGHVDFSADGRISYFPDAANRGGEVVVSYIVKDERGLATAGRLRVLLRPADSNQPPDARNDAVTVRQGQITRLNLLHNDSDPDGDPLRVASLPVRQDIFVTHDGDMLFDATGSAVGVIRDGYSITDGALLDEAQIRIDVLAELPNQNQPPVAVRDDVIIARGQTRTIRVVTNDGDPDGDVIAVTALSDPPAGFTVQQLGPEFLRVTASPSAPDSAEFLYFVSDGVTDPVAASVVLTVTADAPANQSPVARPDVLELRAGLPVAAAVLVNDFDPDGDRLEIVAVGEAEGVDLRLSDDQSGIRVLVPEDRRSGFTFTYEISDGLNRAASVVKVRVIPPEEPNRPPVARPDEARTKPGEVVEAQVTLNDSDPDGDPVRVESIQMQGRGGVATVTDGQQAVNYVPRRDFAGTDRILYTLTDGEHRRTGVLLVGVIGDAENRDPIARDDPEDGAGLIDEGSGPVRLGVLVNDSDPDGDPLRVLDTEQPDDFAGSLSRLDGDSDIAYTPPQTLPDGDIDVVFSYVVTDNRGGTARAQVRLTVVAQPPAPLPLPPMADDLTTQSAKQGTVIKVPVFKSVTDPDGDPAEGSFAFDAPGRSLGGGDVEIPVEPASNFALKYTFTDEQGLSDDGLITVIVDPDLPPTVEQIEVTTAFETPTEPIDIIARASDPEGGPLLGTCCSTSFGGAVTSVDGGRQDHLVVVFTPETGFSGPAGFSFTIADEFGNTISGTVNVEVLPRVNTPPEAQDDAVEVEAGTMLPYDLWPLVGDADLPEDELTLVDAELSGSEGISFDRDGWILELSAQLDAAGERASVAYTVQDAGGETADGTLDVVVTESTAPLPVASDDAATTHQGQPVTVDVTSNDAVYVGSKSLVSVGASDDGTTAVTGDSSITFTPEPEFFGRTQFTYTISDGAGRLEFGTVVVDVIGRPGRPPAPVASPTSARVLLTWGSPAANGAAIDDYDVELEGGTSQGIGVANSFTWAGLENGVEHRFRIRASNEAGFGPWSEWSNAVTPDVLPEAPGAPSVAFGDRQISISWLKPANDGSTIIKYAVTVSGDGTGIRETGDTEYVWKGLDNGNTYCFRVRAVNSLGEGDWSTQSCEVPAAPPDAPSAPVALRGNELVDLSWTPPANNGDPISDYQIMPSLGGTVEIPSQSSYRWGDLTNGAEISFQIRATNKAGWGEWSPPSNVVIPAGEPFTPPPPAAADNRDKQSTVTVTFPDNNGAAIDLTHVRVSGSSESYDLTYNVANPAEGLTQSWVVESLANGATYSFSARACNEVGCSQWSDLSNIVVPKGPPCRVSLDSAEPDVKLVTLGISIDPQREGMTSCDNGAGAFDFELEVNGGAWQTVAPNGNLVRSTAEDATDYTFRVRTTNSIASSMPSAPLSARTPGRPCPPTASVGGGALSGSVSWIADTACENGDPIVEFKIEQGSSGAKHYSGTSRSARFTFSAPGIYQFRVRARNAVGWGPWNAWQQATVYDVPCAPTVGMAGTQIGQVSGTLSHPAGCANLSDIVSYRIELGPAPARSSEGGVRNFVFGNLPPGRYQVQAQAMNEAGWGPLGDIASVTVINVPDRLTVTARSTGYNAVSASWSANANLSPITAWDVDDGGMPGGPASSATSHSWSNVSAGSRTVRVRALNAAGWSEWSRPAAPVTVEDPPPPPPPPPTTPPTTPTTPPTTPTTPPTTPPTPSVRLSVGGDARGVDRNCTSIHCRWLVVSLQNFGPGQHTVECHNSPGGKWHDYLMSGAVSQVCIMGFPGRSVWVTVERERSNTVKRSNTVIWPSQS